MRAIAAVVIAGALVLAAPAGAAIQQGNLVLNGDAEFGPAASDETSHSCPQAWTCPTGYPTLIRYGTTTFPDAAESARIDGGNNFFAGGPPNGPMSPTPLFDANLRQTVDLGASQPEIDAGSVRATIGACLGSWQDQSDRFTLAVSFKPGVGGTGTTIGSLQAVEGPRAENRGYATKLLPRSITVPVPVGARSAQVELFSLIVQGPYNDGYADNASIRLGPSTGPAPPAPACGASTGGPGGGGPGGGGPGGGGPGGDSTKQPKGVLSFGRATIGPDGKARVRIRCNTTQVSRCRGRVALRLVSASASGVRPKRRQLKVRYSIASLKSKTIKVPLRRSDARAIDDYSRRQLRRHRLKLTATTTVGTARVKQTSLLSIRRG